MEASCTWLPLAGGSNVRLSSKLRPRQASLPWSNWLPGYLTPITGIAQDYLTWFIGIVLSFGPSSRWPGNPTSSGHLTPFIGRPYILNLFMLVHLPGVWPVGINPLTQHSLKGESLNLYINFIFISHQILSCIFLQHSSQYNSINHQLKYLSSMSHITTFSWPYCISTQSIKTIQ